MHSPSPRVLLAALILATAADFAAARSYDGKAPLPQDTEEREIAQLFDRWNATLAKGDPTAVAALYARDGMLQPTVSNWMREGRDEITAYFQDFLRKQPQGVINHREIRMLGDGTAMDAGIYTFTLKDGDRSTQVQARYTYVYGREDGEWKILLHHSSAMPEPVRPTLAATN